MGHWGHRSPPLHSRPPTENEWELQALRSLPNTQVSLTGLLSHQILACVSFFLALVELPFDMKQSFFGIIFAGFGTTIKTIVTMFSFYSEIVCKDRDGDLKLVLKSGVVVRSLSDVRTPLISLK